MAKNPKATLDRRAVINKILEKRGELQRAYEHMKKAFSASRPGLLQTDDEEREDRATSA